MPNAIDRFSDVLEDIHVDTVLADCDEIPYERVAGGGVYVPDAQATLTTLTWHVAYVKGGDYVPAYDSAGVAVTQTVDGANGGGYPIPDALYGFPWLKAQGNVDGTIHLPRKG